jgi:hypothetical protein
MRYCPCRRGSLLPATGVPLLRIIGGLLTLSRAGDVFGSCFLAPRTRRIPRDDICWLSSTDLECSEPRSEAERGTTRQFYTCTTSARRETPEYADCYCLFPRHKCGGRGCPNRIFEQRGATIRPPRRFIVSASPKGSASVALRFDVIRHSRRVRSLAARRSGTRRSSRGWCPSSISGMTSVWVIKTQSTSTPGSAVERSHASTNLSWSLLNPRRRIEKPEHARRCQSPEWPPARYRDSRESAPKIRCFRRPQEHAGDDHINIGKPAAEEVDGEPALRNHQEQPLLIADFFADARTRRGEASLGRSARLRIR